MVTGAGGGLGHELRPVFSDHDLILLDRTTLDVTDQAAVDDTVTKHRPEAIIHCAAYTDVDGAEAEPAQAFLLNHTATGYLAQAAERVKAMLVYPSTDYVFDGKQSRPYTEDDFANPLSVYGQSKLKGERVALSENTKTFVVRTSWLYSQTGKSFVATMLDLFTKHDELTVVADEVSSPTYSRDYARALKVLLEHDAAKPGIYHASAAGIASWYDFATEIARQAGAEVTIKPITAAQWGAAAARPKYSKLDTAKIGQLGIELSDWKESLTQFLADRA